MFFLIYKHTDDSVFDDSLKISDHILKILKIFQNCSEGQTNVSKHFPRISEITEDVPRFPKIAKDFWGSPKDVSMIHQLNKFKYNFRDKLDNTEIIDIFTGDNIISSHVRISYRFYQFVTTRYTNYFCIINRE